MKRLIVIAILCTLVIAAITGGVAYTIGLAQAGGSTWEPGHHHWHPFPFGFFVAAIVIAIILRGLFWGGYYRGRCRGWHGDFEQWHRELHERMWNEPKNGGAETR